MQGKEFIFEIPTPPAIAAAVFSLVLHMAGGWFIFSFLKEGPKFLLPPPRFLEVRLVTLETPAKEPPVPAPRRTPRPTIRAAKKTVVPPPKPAVIEPPKPLPAVVPEPEPTEPVPSEGAVQSIESGPSESNFPPVDVAKAAPSPLPETLPVYDADYLDNPAPSYPSLARRFRLEGTVVVRALVNPDGRPETVVLQESSGAHVLDEAAVNAVKNWSFLPARKGDEPIEAWVDIPIRFRLN